MNDVVITYETLFEILRMEKSREALQRLDANFFDSVLEYLQKKNEIINNTQSKIDLFSVSEREKAQKQLMNIKSILKELFNRREKKIINMAINKSRTGSSIIDTSGLLEPEKQIYNILVDALSKFRGSVLVKLLESKLPDKLDIVKQVAEAETKKQEAESPGSSVLESIKMIRFLHAIPRFVGPNMNEYGPYEEDEVANLPNTVANILINKNRAEEIREGF